MVSMLVFAARGLHDEMVIDTKTSRVKKHREDPCPLCFDVDRVLVVLV